MIDLQGKGRLLGALAQSADQIDALLNQQLGESYGKRCAGYCTKVAATVEFQCHIGYTRTITNTGHFSVFGLLMGEWGVVSCELSGLWGASCPVALTIFD